MAAAVRALTKKYIATLDDFEKSEEWSTRAEMARSELDGFITWLEGGSRAKKKAERKK